MAGYPKFVMKSRMMGDYQVRFCERLGVKFPLPTRPFFLFDNNSLAGRFFILAFCSRAAIYTRQRLLKLYSIHETILQKSDIVTTYIAYNIKINIDGLTTNTILWQKWSWLMDFSLKLVICY